MYGGLRGGLRGHTHDPTLSDIKFLLFVCDRFSRNAGVGVSFNTVFFSRWFSVRKERVSFMFCSPAVVKRAYALASARACVLFQRLNQNFQVEFVYISREC